jgi:hypothetical protein
VHSFACFMNFGLCVDDINHCVGGTKHKYAIKGLIILYIWPMQKRTNLSQDEMKYFEEKSLFLSKQ